MARQQGDYSQIWEWIYKNFDINNYFSAEELLYDVKNEFNRTQSYFPVQAEDLVKERFQYRREYAEMQRREDERKQIAEVIGGGKVYESLSDEILDDIRKPEIMGIDMSEYATKRESVIPPDIEKFVEKETFYQRLSKRFIGFFRRK